MRASCATASARPSQGFARSSIEHGRSTDVVDPHPRTHRGRSGVRATSAIHVAPAVLGDVICCRETNGGRSRVLAGKDRVMEPSRTLSHRRDRRTTLTSRSRRSDITRSASCSTRHLAPRADSDATRMTWSTKSGSSSKAQSLGLTLDDIQQLLAGQQRRSHAPSCRKVRDLLTRRIEDIDDAYQGTRASFRRTLHEHLVACERGARGCDVNHRVRPSKPWMSRNVRVERHEAR